MKKWLIGIIALIILLVACVYIFIPDAVSLESNITINTTRQAVYRKLLDRESIHKWWPAKTSADSLPKDFFLNAYRYTINDNNISVLPVTISGKKRQSTTSLYLIPLQPDIVQLHWLGKWPTSYHPLKRLLAFMDAKKINADMNTILEKMQSFFSMPQNIYGYEVQHLLIVDSTFISTIDTVDHYPSTAFIYNRINQLKAYAEQHSAKVTGDPMLNVDDAESHHFVVRAAVPVDKALVSSGNIYDKRMPVNVNILMMEVKGGTATVNAAYYQMLHYVNDRHQTIPGIPFFTLVTDRMQEPDTTKWITRIYCPVR